MKKILEKNRAITAYCTNNNNYNFIVLAGITDS